MQDLWQHIRQGDNLIRPIPRDRIEDSFTPEERLLPTYVAARPGLPDVDMFDAAFFGMYPREAALTDPQGRVFLEICHEVLEQAGHDPERFPGRIGVWAGSSFSTYLVRNIMAERKTALEILTGLQISHYPEMTGNLADSLATRVAYRLDLKGPAMTVATACSTSLTAMAQAVLGLRAGQCDMALAGGVSITFPQTRGYLCQEGGMVSPDGICRPFDADAGGTVFGHGAGVVALRRLEDALADGDRVLAVIRGVGINNDGADKISYTAPSVTGQVDAIRMAWAEAGLTPGDADYIECHGTATPLGDPIELRSLSLAAGPGRGAETCAIGSIKGNIGHLDAAAGVMGSSRSHRCCRSG
ncbi:polyketide synthase [Gemmobacter sp. 24YEA27]|uniref:beta-ketoacyl synthase N-terminal-like domain-containing protein n=1 Tax=Gemmobacter sp. 24YEA27 TaxID=3040672 RepID=UPI0024B3401D|nr:polyketide synthase [Gemmobacter sp. 24YEA27]